MGGRSKSSTSSVSTIKDTTTNTVDNRVVADDGRIGGNINVNLSDITSVSKGGASTSRGSRADLGGSGEGGGPAGGGDSSGGGVSLSISTGDFGALDAASELSDKAFSLAEASGKRLAESVGDTMSNAQKATSDALELAESSTRDEGARTTQLFLIVSAVALGTIVYFKRRGA